jgi:HSP20 family molecular chaperone IbpA
MRRSNENAAQCKGRGNARMPNALFHLCLFVSTRSLIMLFTPVIRRAAFAPNLRAFDRFFDEALAAPGARANSVRIEQDDKAYTLSFDVPGVSREELSIGIEANVVRLETLPQAKRQYKAAYELPQDIDVAASVAKLENGVLTIKLAKKLPESKVTKLAIN